MDYTAEERAYLWLCACTKTEYRTRVALLRAAPSPAALLAEAETYFPAAGAEKSFTPSRERREKEADLFLAGLEKKGYFAVTLISEDYPDALKNISLPPLVLYGAGRRELLGARKFCVVGSRLTPPWAGKLGRTIAETLSRRFAIVTGLAEGGDLAAIEGGMSEGNLICVLPCGLDECYPAAHVSVKEKVRKKGLLLSELLPWETAKKYSFHARNRILAGLSEGVLVLSAAEKSGTLITANCALDFGRDVFALPHNAGARQGEGCNELIKRGAYLATKAEDILSVYGMEAEKEARMELSSDEGRVLDALKDYGELHPAQIAEKTGLKIFEVTAVLSSLEIKGAVVRGGGNHYNAI